MKLNIMLRQNSWQQVKLAQLYSDLLRLYRESHTQCWFVSRRDFNFCIDSRLHHYMEELRENTGTSDKNETGTAVTYQPSKVSVSVLPSLSSKYQLTPMFTDVHTGKVIAITCLLYTSDAADES